MYENGSDPSTGIPLAWGNPDAEFTDGSKLAGVYAVVQNTVAWGYSGDCKLAYTEDGLWTIDGYVMVSANTYMPGRSRGNTVETPYGMGLICDHTPESEAPGKENTVEIYTTWIPECGYFTR